jgi:hypothetical protein
MRSRVPLSVLLSLVSAGCGATHAEPEPEHRSELQVTRGAENAPSDSTRSADDLARDPAWQSIPEGGTRVAVSDAPDAGVVTARCVGACSAEGDACGDSRGWPCRCEWHHDVVCGGAYRPPNPPTLGWTCAPLDPDADRGDGCPFRQPRAGQACSAPASRSCHYAPGCGWSGVDAACVGGRWALTEFHRPPPP